MAVIFTTIDDVSSLTTPKLMMAAIDTNFGTTKTAVDLNTLKTTNATHSGEVTGSVALTITAKAVTYTKIQDVSATDKLLGRSTAGAGVTEEITCTAAGRALLDDDDAATQLGTLGAAASGANSDITSLSAMTTISMTGALFQTPDSITATSDGVAASITTALTLVTTNGDTDLDNVTLVDGATGQIKTIVCEAEGDSSDTWKITPAHMVGGAQITFVGVGEGCSLVWSASGWIVSGNNGGTIS